MSAPTRAATAPHMVLGTAGYMSPEQVKGQPADHRSDVFAFGCVLYEMLALRRAFGGDSTMDAMSSILREAPPPANSTSARPIPPALLRIVERCLEKAPGAIPVHDRSRVRPQELVEPGLRRDVDAPGCDAGTAGTRVALAHVVAVNCRGACCGRRGRDFLECDACARRRGHVSWLWARYRDGALTSRVYRSWTDSRTRAKVFK